MRIKILLWISLVLIFSDAFSETIKTSNQTNVSKVTADNQNQNLPVMTLKNQNKVNESIQIVGSESTNSTDKFDTSLPIQSLQDAFLLEIDYLKEQISLTEKKIGLIEQLRTYYLKNNISIPSLSHDILEKSISIESLQTPNLYAKPPSYYASNFDNKIIFDESRERGDLNLMSKIFKKYTLEFSQTIKDFLFLPTKSMQRAADEPATSAIMIFLTTNNEIFVYSLNGQLILNFIPGHKVKKLAVNSFTDEYIIITLGTDNTIRLFSLNTYRVQQKSRQPQENSTEKNVKKFDRPKFTTEFNHSLEYIYDLENHKIIKEEEANLVLNNRKERNYGSISTIIGRAIKFIALGDVNGDLVLINRNGTYKGRFTFPDSKFVSIQKFHPNPIYTTEKIVGFFNPIQLDIAGPYCDLPGEIIQKVEMNQFSTNEFFLLLRSGDILFYDVKHSATQCKAVAKRTIPSQNSNINEFNIYSTKDFLLIKDNKKSPNIFAHNITDVVFANVHEIEYHNITFYPKHAGHDDIAKSDYITHRISFSSSNVGAYFEFRNGTSIFTMYEVTILAKPSSDWLSSFRIPIVFVAVILAIGYQFWTRRKKRDDEEVMETLSKFNIKDALGGRSSNELNSLKESIDSLSKQTNKLQDDLGNVTKKSFINRNYDDNIQEITTKKYL